VNQATCKSLRSKGDGIIRGDRIHAWRWTGGRFVEDGL